MTNATLVRIRRCTSPRTLARAASLFLVWGNRPLADAAHIQRGRILECDAAMRRHIARQRAEWAAMAVTG